MAFPERHGEGTRRQQGHEDKLPNTQNDKQVPPLATLKRLRKGVKGKVVRRAGVGQGGREGGGEQSKGAEGKAKGTDEV